MTRPIVIEPALHEAVTDQWHLAVPKVIGKRATVELWEICDTVPHTRDLEEIVVTLSKERKPVLKRFALKSGLAAAVLDEALLKLNTQVDLWWHRRQTTQAAPRLFPEDSRPVLQVESDIEPPTNELERLLIADSDVGLYQRGRTLCEIRHGAPALKFLHRPMDLPRVSPASAARIREMASHVARFDIVNPDSGKIARGLPPQWLIDTLMARGAWQFSPIEGIVNLPTLRPDGTLLTKEGYDVQTGLFLHYGGVVFPEVSEAPTQEEAIAAVDVLWEVFQDFPYTDVNIGFSATLAALLSCVCRYAILGRIPMIVVRSTSRGSGKGKLIDAISLIALGRTAQRMAQTMDEEEERKRLLAIALAAIPLLHIDNVSHPLGSGVLDYALTSPTIGDRILGKSEDVEAPLNTVFFASGNNMMFKGDTVRRVLPIDLDPKMENPSLRDDFEHAHLEAWVEEHRPELVHACLTIMRGFFAAQDAQKPLPTFGSYEVWSDVIRQAVQWAGEVDPCEARLDLEGTSEPLYEQRDEVLTQWGKCYSGTGAGAASAPRSVQSILGDIGLKTAEKSVPRNEWHAFRDALGALTPRYDGLQLNARPVGDALRAMKRVVIGDRRLSDAPKKDRRGAALWFIECITTTPRAESEESRRVTAKRLRLQNNKNGENEKEEKNTYTGIEELGMTMPHSADSAKCLHVNGTEEEKYDDIPF